MAEKTTQLYSLSICARATLDMHSLNNEGSEGTQIQTRMVDIVAADGRLYNVNAISGDMFKHIQAEHLYHIARNASDLPLCAACQVFDANRISADPEFREKATEKEGNAWKLTDAEAINEMIVRCTLDDLEGNLFTEAGRSIPRKSIAEFGWVVGIPIDKEGRELTKTGTYFHVKYARERGEATTTEEARRANLGQTPFHRPASSGIYAIVSHYEISRISFNDITRRYALDEQARQARYRALLESILYTFVQPRGAMRAAQLPHIVSLEGVLSYTTTVLPAPTVSPLNPDYRAESECVAKVLNGLHSNSVIVQPFNNLGEFAAVMQGLIETTAPYTATVVE